MKKHLSRYEEFQIMKLVLDKFLWMGVLIMAYGFYRMVAFPSISYGLSILIAGAIVLLTFMVIIVKEYEFMK